MGLRIYVIIKWFGIEMLKEKRKKDEQKWKIVVQTSNFKSLLFAVVWHWQFL